MVIGDQHPYPKVLSRPHAFVAGDPVIDGDDQVRPILSGQGHDLRGEAVIVLEAVGNPITDPSRAERAQNPNRQRATGGPIGVEIGHD